MPSYGLSPPIVILPRLTSVNVNEREYYRPRRDCSSHAARSQGRLPVSLESPAKFRAVQLWGLGSLSAEARTRSRGQRAGMRRINGRALKGAVECCRSLRCNGDHEGTFFQGYFLPPGVAAVNDVVRSSALCAGNFRPRYQSPDRGARY
jgi:hypothetical protein